MTVTIPSLPKSDVDSWCKLVEQDPIDAAYKYQFADWLLDHGCEDLYAAVKGCADNAKWPENRGGSYRGGIWKVDHPWTWFDETQLNAKRNQDLMYWRSLLPHVFFEGFLRSTADAETCFELIEWLAARLPRLTIPD